MNAFIRDLQTYVTLHERLAKLLPWRDGGELLAVAKAIIAAQEGYENVLNTVVVGDGKTASPFPRIAVRAGGSDKPPKAIITALTNDGETITLPEAILQTIKRAERPVSDKEELEALKLDAQLHARDIGEQLKAGLTLKNE